MVNSICEKKIIINSKRDMWFFYPLTSGKTGYAVKRSMGQATSGQPIMDEVIIEYDIIVDERDSIHIVALTAEQKVVYIRHDLSGWTKHVLYSFSGKAVDISGLTIMKGAGSLQLFYIYSDKGGGCALFHHQWTGNEWRGYKVFDASGKGTGICYDADIGKKNRLSAAATEGNTLSVWDFDGIKWVPALTRDDDIWNRAEYMVFREGLIMLKNDNGVFFIRNVRQKDAGPFREIVDGNHVTKGPVLINKRNTLYIAWVEENNLIYRTSYDEGSSWGRVKYYHHAQGKRLEVYGFDSSYSLLIDTKRVIATAPPEIHIPFLHRSVEKVNVPVISENDAKDTDYSRQQGQDYYAKSAVNTGQCPQANYEERAQTEEKDNHGEYSDLQRLKAELYSLRQLVERDVLKRLDGLDEQVKEIRDKFKDPAKTGVPIGTGSIITQDMMNRYIRRK